MAGFASSNKTFGEHILANRPHDEDIRLHKLLLLLATKPTARVLFIQPRLDGITQNSI
jgi:hypothetical protein